MFTGKLIFVQDEITSWAVKKKKLIKTHFSRSFLYQPSVHLALRSQFFLDGNEMSEKSDILYVLSFTTHLRL